MTASLLFLVIVLFEQHSFFVFKRGTTREKMTDDARHEEEAACVFFFLLSSRNSRSSVGFSSFCFCVFVIFWVEEKKGKTGENCSTERFFNKIIAVTYDFLFFFASLLRPFFLPLTFIWQYCLYLLTCFQVSGNYSLVNSIF